MDTAVVVAGGTPARQVVPPDLDGAFWIAADSGLELARDLGARCDVVVGDLDSLATSALERALADGTRLERHPPDKDATDLELALALAAAHRPRRLVVLGGAGGRLDHLLGNVAALTAPALAAIEVEAYLGEAHLRVVRRSVDMWAEPGTAVSLLAHGGPARGVRTTGLRWSLSGATLQPHATLGISNEVVGPQVSVSVEAGLLLLAVADGRRLRGVRVHEPSAVRS